MPDTDPVLPAARTRPAAGDADSSPTSAEAVAALSRAVSVTLMPVPANVQEVRVDTLHEIASYRLGPDGDAPRFLIRRADDLEAYQAFLDHRTVQDLGGVIDGPNTVVPAQVRNVRANLYSARYQDAQGQWHWVSRSASPALYRSVAALQISLPPDPGVVPPLGASASRSLLWEQDSANYQPTLSSDFDLSSVFDLGGMPPEQLAYINEMIAQSPTLVAQLRQAAEDGIRIQWAPEDEHSSMAIYHGATRTIEIDRGLILSEWTAQSPRDQKLFAACMVHSLAHELGHARELKVPEPSPWDYPRESAYRHDFFQYFARSEGAAYTNVLTVAEELAQNSDLSLFMSSWSESQGYVGSEYQTVHQDASLTPAQREQRIEAMAKRDHPGFASGGYYQTLSHKLWQQRVQQQEL
ncbi:MAG: hypothetical protein V4739_14925 [Pseudomonadota bacterium]